jgi:signal transduction histidine kinase
MRRHEALSFVVKMFQRCPGIVCITNMTAKMTRILLLENESLNVHSLREESRRSGVCFLYESAATAAEFHRLLSLRPSIVVATLDGLKDGMECLTAQEIASSTQAAGVVLFLVGGDTGQERDILSGLTGQFAATCRRARLPWLPMLLERTLRDSQEMAERTASLTVAAAQLQQAAEQMREVQKLAIIGRITGSIVHEINNPLEAITNLVFLLSIDEQLPPHLRPYVDRTERELKRVADIAKQTLSFCRETETPVRVQLSDLLEEVLLLYARRVGEKRITVERRYESEESVLLFPGEMRQVYANLLANAIEATSPGGRIVLRIHNSCHRTANGTLEGVRVVVADNGSGIPEEIRRRLGQPFFTTKGQRGTGLGLWVSQTIVKRYGGQIRLRSSTGTRRHGTTFNIFMPLNLGPQVVELAASAAKPQIAPEAPVRLEGLRLLANGS